MPVEAVTEALCELICLSAKAEKRATRVSAKAASAGVHPSLIGRAVHPTVPSTVGKSVIHVEKCMKTGTSTDVQLGPNRQQLKNLTKKQGLPACKTRAHLQHNPVRIYFKSHS